MTSERIRRMPDVHGEFTPHILIPGSKLLFVGDSPTKADLKAGVPFSGDGARMLEKACRDVGIPYSKASKTVALDYYPTTGDASTCIIGKRLSDKIGGVLWGETYIEPKAARSFHRLHAFIEQEQPDLIVLFGGVSLLGVLGEASITAWRGSVCEMVLASGKVCIVVPTFNPAALARKRSWTLPFMRDLQRVAEGNFQMPDFQFMLGCTCQEYLDKLEELHQEAVTGFEQTGVKRRIACDIEARMAGRYLTVFGIAWSTTEAMAVPFVSVERTNYFTVEEEFLIVKALRKLLTSPAVAVEGQNFNFDATFVASQHGYLIKQDFDTMTAGHVLWTKGMPLDLAYLASLYCDWYRYWKADGKDFHKSFKTVEDQLTYWRYNCYDNCYAFEIAGKLREHFKEEEPANRVELLNFQRHMQNIIIKPTLAGIRFNAELQAKMRVEAEQLMAQYEAWFQYMIPDEMLMLRSKTGKQLAPWWSYAVKLSHFLYKELGIPVIVDKKTKSPTTGGDAPKQVGRSEPLLKLVMQKLDEYRSIEQIYSLYLKAVPSKDGRVRTSYGIGGTDTFRLNSKKDIFDEGMNLQNVTKG